MVGGETWWCSASTLNTDSIPPAPPSKCPVIDLVELTTSVRACSPNTALIASVSFLSPSGVDVPWAFIFERGDDLLPRHPVVLYESICYFILLVIVINLYRRLSNTRPGFYVAFFFTFTFSIRFLLEFMKEPEGMVLGPISKTQLLSVPLIMLGLILFIFTFRHKSNIPTQNTVNSNNRG